MIGLKKMILVSLVLTATVSLATASEVADKSFEQLPFGCFVTKSEVIPRNQTDAIGKKLGTSLKRLSNTYLQVQGKPIQVNILEAETGAEAPKLHKTISKMNTNYEKIC